MSLSTSPQKHLHSVSSVRPSPELPTLVELGEDLLTTTPWQRRWALARPFLLVLCFIAVWHSPLWWLAPLVMFLLFVAIVTVTHDVVHGALGLSPRQSECWLFLLGAFLLESGHAYRATHQQHHRVFPGPNDPEGDPARMHFWQAVLWGPLFCPDCGCGPIATPAGAPISSVGSWPRPVGR